MKRFFLYTTIAACMLMFGSSCIKNDNSTSPQNGAFLLCNVSPDAPALNVSLNSKDFGSGLAYSIYTVYLAQTAGSYAFSFSDSMNSNLLTKTVTIEPNVYYSYFVVDSFSKIKSAFVQDNIIVPGTDSVYIRFFNFSPDANAITFRDTALIPTINYSTRTFNDQEGNPSYASFDRKHAGVYTLKLVRPDGTLIISRKDTLASGHVYTYFAKGFLNGTGAQGIGIGKITNF